MTKNKKTKNKNKNKIKIANVMLQILNEFFFFWKNTDKCYHMKGNIFNKTFSNQ